MARILMADDGIRFDGLTLRTQPLGGAETAFISLAEALAARGHEVLVRNRCNGPMEDAGVHWAPLSAPVSGDVDLYIANRSYRLIGSYPHIRRRVFWIHNPARYLMKVRYLWRLLRHRPVIVFSGAYHLASYPALAPAAGRRVIPYGIEERFRTASSPAGEAPPPRALFTSNPMRSLDWLLEVWETHIHPHVPAAELHVFSGPGTYGSHGSARAATMERVLDMARAMASKGVVVRAPVAKDALVEEMRAARVLLYRGDPGETFCLAVAEAQAMGLPAVLGGVGCVGERILPDQSGFIAPTPEDFGTAAVRLLTDDALWRRQHEAALAHQRSWSWDCAATAFEEFLPCG